MSSIVLQEVNDGCSAGLMVSSYGRPMIGGTGSCAITDENTTLYLHTIYPLLLAI
jgi:hypothetical protein